MIAVRIGALLLLATLAAAKTPVPKQGKSVAEPKLPVMDLNGCGSGDISKREPYELDADDRFYSSWQDKRTLLGILKNGTNVTLVGGVNIIRKPDKDVITQKVYEAPFVGPGDKVLGYGYHPDGTTSFWSKGMWFTEHEEHVASKGVCGFADKTQCTINIIKRGKQEWWMQLKTSSGETGWILGMKINGDNFWSGPNAGQACRD
jgi:hypothetical protein